MFIHHKGKTCSDPLCGCQDAERDYRVSLQLVEKLRHKIIESMIICEDAYDYITDIEPTAYEILKEAYLSLDKIREKINSSYETLKEIKE